MPGYSRAQFLRRGAVAAGGVSALGLFDPLAAFGRSAGSPRPIPGGIKFVGEGIEFVPANPDIHVLPPTAGFEASTISDFNGVLAAAEIQGRAHGSDGSAYDFDADMRVMQGWYVDTDDKLKKGTFGFIWIDLFPTGAVGDPTKQVHDWEPGIAENGLFWTIPVAPGMVDVDAATGAARFVGRNVPVPDFHDFFNAVGGGPSIPSRVDFEVTWTGAGPAQHIADPAFGFVGDYVSGQAQITFTAAHDKGTVIYRSDPDTTKQTSPGPPVVGSERNGRFV